MLLEVSLLGHSYLNLFMSIMKIIIMAIYFKILISYAEISFKKVKLNMNLNILKKKGQGNCIPSFKKRMQLNICMHAYKKFQEIYISKC
jgi:hypothetical protein